MRKKESEECASPPDNHTMEKIRILVIDDDPITLKIMKKILKSDNYLVETASSGKEGLEKFKKNIFDIIFLDLNMPDIHGLNVLKEMREINPDMPISIITGNEKEPYFDSALKLNANDYIEKPLSPYLVKLSIDMHVLIKKDKLASH